MPDEVTACMVDCMAMASKCFGKPAFYGLKFKRLRVLGLDVSDSEVDRQERLLDLLLSDSR